MTKISDSKYPQWYVWAAIGEVPGLRRYCVPYPGAHPRCVSPAGGQLALTSGIYDTEEALIRRGYMPYDREAVRSLS